MQKPLKSNYEYDIRGEEQTIALPIIELAVRFCRFQCKSP